MFTFKIIKAPKKNASVEEWCQFAATAPREMVVKVYRQLSRSAVNGRVLPLLEERIFSFDKRFAIYTKDVFADYMQVPAGISNRQIKERVEKCQKFPLLIVERCGGFPSSGWFRGMAITKDLILAGVIAEADMAFKYAEQVVEMNDFIDQIEQICLASQFFLNAVKCDDSYKDTKCVFVFQKYRGAKVIALLKELISF